MPVITVGMPVYNGELYLEESIKSVLAQTFDDFEFLISDNGSSDRTPEICGDYAARDKRISYWRNPENIGAAGNYNILYQKAKAPYFRWSNADDLLHPKLHETCLRALEENPDAVLAAGTTILIDQNGAETGAFDDNLNITNPDPSDRLRAFLQQVTLTNVIYGLMRTAPLGKTDLMGDGSIPAADTIMMGQLILHGHFLQLPTPLFYRRMHEQSSSADRSDNERQARFWSAGASDFRHPCARQIAAYMRAISKAPVSTQQTIALYGLMASQIWANKRDIIRELL